MMVQNWLYQESAVKINLYSKAERGSFLNTSLTKCTWHVCQLALINYFLPIYTYICAYIFFFFYFFIYHLLYTNYFDIYILYIIFIMPIINVLYFLHLIYYIKYYILSLLMRLTMSTFWTSS